ncbi:MAG: hypothetical protein JWQ42_1485 [Edaphobacter sp.]|nr:hypothetical protein [Edaphobacter sp.]
MSKLLKLTVALGCLICVLAIFIAPSVDMPETVLRDHHAVRTTVLQVPAAVALASGSAFAVRHETLGSRHTFYQTKTAGALGRKASFVMRC